MATAAVASPRDVLTTLNYYAPIGTEAPYQYVYEAPPNIPQNNLGSETHPVTIHDVRGRESEYTLDRNGFQFVKHQSKETEFTDHGKIEKEYYPEVIELLKREVGAKRVFIFDHTIRKQTPDTSTPESEAKNARGPVERVHIDQTFDASTARVHHHLGPEASRLLKSRVRIINVWRPIGHPVAHKPLAVSDWRHLDTEHDLVPVRFIYPDRTGGIYNVKFNPDHKWHYLSSQAPDEVLLIKCFDSEVDRARLTPHSAFLDETSPKEAPQRESIEVRCLVFDSE
ncbi:hypothetical protein K474DRAFT_1635579 [Panus rudis PR-1116 ss-1]|nr:hypothetical protein K474DRAFT_1635579 [Panus rudis PR-1116 ss-1]